MKTHVAKASRVITVRIIKNTAKIQIKKINKSLVCTFSEISVTLFLLVVVVERVHRVLIYIKTVIINRAPFLHHFHYSSAVLEDNDLYLLS